jgi:CheY-like chemotaxis protein
VRADPGQIEQIIMNLVVNARDAMAVAGERPPAGTLTVEMANVELDEGAFRPTEQRVSPGPYVMLAVSDTGCGMTSEVRRQIFEPFFTTKEPGRGTGLGLSTVFGIVKQHGGYVVCESEPGQGSTFRIYLPRDEGGEETPAEELAPSSTPGLRRGETVTALVAEDDADVREIVGRGLEEAGYRVYTAAGVEEALAVAATVGGPIHLLVTDMVMPGGSGQLLAERLLTTSPALKVLFISAYFDDSIAGLEAPGAFLLQKPFSPDDLARKAREVLDG